MDTYPAVPMCEASQRDARSGNRVSTEDNLSVSFRPLADSTRWDPTVCHRHVSLADLNSILDFETAHRGIPFQLDYIPEGGGAPNMVTCVFGPQGIEATPIPGFDPVVFDVVVPMLQAD